jgi:hypothetical protein
MSVWENAKAAGKQPFPRSYLTASELNGKIYIYGGKNDSGNQTDTTLFVLNTGGSSALLYDPPSIDTQIPCSRFEVLEHPQDNRSTSNTSLWSLSEHGGQQDSRVWRIRRTIR